MFWKKWRGIISECTLCLSKKTEKSLSSWERLNICCVLRVPVINILNLHERGVRDHCWSGIENIWLEDVLSMNKLEVLNAKEENTVKLWVHIYLGKWNKFVLVIVLIDSWKLLFQIMGWIPVRVCKWMVIENEILIRKSLKEGNLHKYYNVNRIREN